MHRARREGQSLWAHLLPDMSMRSPAWKLSECRCLGVLERFRDTTMIDEIIGH